MHRTFEFCVLVCVLFISKSCGESNATEGPHSTAASVEFSSGVSTSTFTAETVSDFFTEAVTEHISAQKWKKAEEVVNKMFVMMYKQVLPLMLRSNEDLNLSPPCTRGFMKMMTGIKQSKVWAFKSKLPFPIFFYKLSNYRKGKYFLDFFFSCSVHHHPPPFLGPLVCWPGRYLQTW